MYQHIDANRSFNELKPRDSLRLGAKQEIAVLLANEGLDTERVIFSENVIKLNAKGRQQRRILMITQSAIYNLKPKKCRKSQRRIRISDIGMVTMSSISPEFAIHVPSEYDYHFISKNKSQIGELLQQLYYKETQSKLIVIHSDLKHLKDIVLTKKLAKFESTNSKHAMQQSIADLKRLEENPPPIQTNTTVEEYEGCEIVYSPIVDNGDNEDHIEEENDENACPNHNNDADDNAKDIALYQSLVYGNHQLLLRQESKLFPQ
eukprot:208005_1